MLRPLLLTIFINCFLFTHTQSQIDGKLDQNITSKFNSNKSFNTIKKTEVFNGSNEIIDAITQHGITCLKPTGLSTSDHNQNSVTLNWLPVTGAQSYEITVVQSITNATIYTYYSNTHNYILSGVAANGHYFWSVRAICNPGDTSELANSEFHNASPAANFITNDCSGRFTDSGGEFGNYNQNENYTFTISPVNAATVSLTFTDFDLETNFDYIRIFDGVGTNAPTLGTYTGNTTPPVITSTGSSLTIQFISNASNQSSGWIASWTCSSTSPSTILTNPILLNNNSVGFLDCNRSYHDFYDSGNSTGAYGNNENYTRTFCNTDPTKAVRLSFRPNPTAAQQLSISSTTTSNDYLYFYNGADTTANLIGVYTGASTSASQPGTFISSGACLTVKFNSDASFVGSGWKARLYCSDPPTNLGSVEVGGTEGTKVFTDIGGISSNYNNNENYVVTYCPHTSAPIDDVVWAEFTSTVGLERSWDYLYVFDGLDTDNSRLICAYTGDATNTNTLETIKASIMNPSGCLTFQFFSDESTTASGWEANISTGEARLAYASETCNTATFVNKTGSDYAGSTTLATGTPGTDDPSLNISLPSLPECSGSNEITRLENTVWYRFITPDTICIPTSMHIRLKNISCQGKGAGGSGLQFVLYEINQCAAGTVWPTPVYCSDKLNSGDSVDVASLLLSNQSYYLMVDGFSGQHCNFDLRFDIETSGNPIDCILPLELLGFWGNKEPNTNILEWETAHEDNIFGFFIERAKGTEFHEIGFVQSNPTTNNMGAHYIFNDKNYWRNNVNYYRLRQVENDGMVTYSPTISIDRRTNQNDQLRLKVFPNPAKEWISFGLDNKNENTYDLGIFDITGKLIYQQNGQIGIGYWSEQLNTSNFNSGMYIYHLQVGEDIFHGKFEKN